MLDAFQGKAATVRRCECGCGAPLVERSDRIVRFASRQCCGRAKRGVPLTAYPGFTGGVFFDAHERRWRIRCRDGATELYARAVMEAKLKRPLTSEEIVHHENEDTTDDRPENLELTDRPTHIRHHDPRGWRRAAA